MKKLSFTIIIFLTFGYSGFAQNYQLHSVYMYSFIRYIQWPETSKAGDFVIGVAGDSPITTYLEKMAAVKKAGNRNIIIKELTESSNLSGVDILFVSNSYNKAFSTILAEVASSSTLIITEREGLGSAGSNINFILRNGKLGFELNRSAMKRSNLKVSSELTRLAVLI